MSDQIRMVVSILMMLLSIGSFVLIVLALGYVVLLIFPDLFNLPFRDDYWSYLTPVLLAVTAVMIHLPAIIVMNRDRS